MSQQLPVALPDELVRRLKRSVGRTVVVVPLSAGPQPHLPIVVPTGSAGEGSVAICDQVRAVDKRRLARSNGRLSSADITAVEAGLRSVLEP
jgi:mRNA interferase MazF